jgi:hypothetical protein
MNRHIERTILPESENGKSGVCVFGLCDRTAKIGWIGKDKDYPNGSAGICAACENIQVALSIQIKTRVENVMNVSCRLISHHNTAMSKKHQPERAPR